jgi:hypothetical protein
MPYSACQETLTGDTPCLTARTAILPDKWAKEPAPWQSDLGTLTTARVNS